MSALSIDLRQRIFSYNLTHSVRKTAKLFGVSPDTVQRLKNLFNETGGLAPRPCDAVHEHAVSLEGEMYLQALLVDRPDLSLKELCETYERVYRTSVGTTTMHNLLKRLNYSRKKKHSTTRKRTATGTKTKKTSISTS